MWDWKCSGCGRHYNMSVNECSYCRDKTTITTGGTQPTSDNKPQGKICPTCKGSGHIMPKCEKCNDTGIIAKCSDGVYTSKVCPNGCPAIVGKLAPVR
jgi:hypothetical protein